MTERATRRVAWSYLSAVLTSAAVAVKGELACWNTAAGEIVPGQTSTTLIPIGYFDESMTGDGVLEVRVRLFREVDLHWWDNDTAPNDVNNGDRGQSVYIKDGRTVSALSTGRSIAGRAWAVHATKGVLVEGGLAVTGPTGASAASVIGGGVATRAALKAVAAGDRYDGELTLVRSDGSEWRFVAAATQTEDEAQELVLTPDAGTGRWLRADKTFVLKAPVSAAMADGATILTVPAGMALRPIGLPFWEVTTAWSGGSSSAIGVASSKTGYTTAGDVLGGASGDVAATLGSTGVKAGTIGPKMDTEAEEQALILVAADTLTYEEITSAFTAGAGFVCVPVALMMTA